MATVDKGGDVMVEGEFVGRIEGLKFRPDPSADAAQTKTLQQAAAQPVAAALTQRVETLYAANDKDIEFTEQGGIVWDNVVVGRIMPGGDALSPDVVVYADDLLEAPSVERAQRRLQQWIDRKVAALFQPLVAMRDDAALTGIARGVAFQIIEGLGILPRNQAAQDIKALEQDQRAALRRHGMRFGQYTIFAPALLKPAPTRLRLVLWSVHHGMDEAPSPPPPGLVTIPAREGVGAEFYTMAGYRRAGARAIRIDMLERLADMIRPMDARAGFEATPDMLSISGLTHEQFADLMTGLGYRTEKGERVKGGQTVPDDAATPEAEAAAPEAPAESTAPAESEAPEETTTEAEARGEPTPQGAETEAPEASAEPETTVAEEGATVVPEALTEAAAPETPDETAVPEAPAEPAEPEAPAEPVEMEVFYLFRTQPRNRRPRRDHGERKPREGGGGAGGEEKKRERRPRNRKPADKRESSGGERGGGEPGKGRPPRKGKREESGAPRKREFTARPERRNKPADPDSPFAVLKQLVDKD